MFGVSRARVVVWSNIMAREKNMVPLGGEGKKKTSSKPRELKHARIKDQHLPRS